MNAHINNLVLMAIENIQKGDLNTAERLLNTAIKILPRDAEIFRLIGVVLALRKNLEDALKMFERSNKIDPNNWHCHSNRGNVLRELRRFNEAFRAYDMAITLQPKYAEAYNNRGNLFQNLKKYDRAIGDYQKAIALEPSYADAYSNLGNSLRKVDSIEDALDAYQKAIFFGGDNDLILGSYINCKMQLCNWDGIEQLLSKFTHNNILRKDKLYPFHLLSVCDDPFLIKEFTEGYMKSEYPAKFDLGHPWTLTDRNKIRIGYFSPDLRNHAVSFLIAGMLELHDRAKFEIIAFSMGGRNQTDDMVDRLYPCFDEFIDVSEVSDMKVAQISREMRIDIAVDLAGLTQDGRPGIFSYRAAPIQVGYIGYLATMGTSYIDYIIADEVIIPRNLQDAYSEKVMYLPSYQANDPKRKIADKVFTREELGLPKRGMVYCCFNNNYKITPAILDSWSLILKSVIDSCILLHAENSMVRENLIAEFQLRGIDGGRVFFAERLPRDEYLARYRVADLFLDTSPYNAGTTASDALWAGLPVLTYLGRSFSARMCGSLLNAIGLSELVASSQKEYEDLAISIGRDPEIIAGLKKKLAQNRLIKPLFDVKLFTQNLELAYTKVYERCRLGLPPDHIY